MKNVRKCNYCECEITKENNGGDDTIYTKDCDGQVLDVCYDCIPSGCSYYINDIHSTDIDDVMQDGGVDFDTAIYIMEEFGSWKSYCELEGE